MEQNDLQDTNEEADSIQDQAPVRRRSKTSKRNTKVPGSDVVLSENASSQVVEIDSPIQPGELNDVEKIGRLAAIRNANLKLETFLKSWENQQSEERSLRQKYAKWLLLGLFVQFIIVNMAFFAIGLHWITVDKWISTSFILAVLAEIVSMTNIVIKYLFPKQGTEVLALIEKL